MNTETFFDKFDQLVDGPDAVAKMRELVLKLAVQGKLVPQDSSDEPARILISQIADEKRRLVAAKIIREKDEAPPIADDEIPFEVPFGWEWARLSSITRRIHYGYTASAKKELSDIRLLRITDIQNNLVDWPSVPGCEIAQEEVTQYQLERGDILVARTGGTVGKTYLVQDVPVVAVFASYLIRIQGGSSLFDRYLKLFLESPIYWVQLEEGARGAAQPNVNGQTLGRMVISVPPLAEQKRIVAKVDELMAICDRLEAQLKERETKLAALSCASLSRFAESPTPANLEYIFHKSYSITPADLRKTILTLAVQGKLVPQDPNDEPAIKLLERIQKSTERLIKNRTIRRHETKPINEEILPFHIPQSWAWTRLGEIGDWGSGSTPSRGNNAYYGGGITWLKSGELNDTQSLSGSSETVTDLALSVGSFRRNQPGDVLFAMYGATIGKVAILSEAAVTNQAVCGCTPFEGVSNRYLFTFLLSQRANFHEASEGGAQPNLSKIKIVAFPFPLPPYPEQKRIVAKVEQMMALVDQLETQLTASRATAAKLMEAVVSELTAA